MKPGVLLLHGFTSHRSSLEVLIPELEKRGLEWHLPILAGHGGSPRDLKDKRWTDWHHDAEQAFRYLRQAHEQVIIVALSMGALLALELAVAHQADIPGLVLISPCLRFKNPAAKHTRLIARVLPRFPNAAANKFSSEKYAVRDKGYQWFPTKTYQSYWERTQTMAEIIQAVRCPVRIIQSRLDMIADPAGAQEIYNLLPGTKELLWHEKSGHEMLLDCETIEVIREILDFPALVNAR